MAHSVEIEKNLNTDLKSICPFVDDVAKKILVLTGKEEEVFKIKLALEEAITNAMRHGNKLTRDKLVTVKIQASRKKAFFDVHDEGAGFDFLRLSDPTAQENLRRPSGRGIFLMRKLMDNVEFYDGGRGVRVSKTLSA
jgi:serine/threonine-protein kinase RsbW